MMTDNNPMAANSNDMVAAWNSDMLDTMANDTNNTMADSNYTMANNNMTLGSRPISLTCSRHIISGSSHAESSACVLGDYHMTGGVLACTQQQNHQ